MRTKIISAFPGMGKTYYYNAHKDICLDSDSSEFSWVIDNGVRVRNPDFPNNYIKHIKENIGKYKYIFVSSHKEVREALLDNCIFFYLIFPQENFKENFIQRYIDRGSPKEFIELVSKNWELWIGELLEYNHIEGVKTLWHAFSIEREIRHMKCVEGGDR